MKYFLAGHLSKVTTGAKNTGGPTMVADGTPLGRTRCLNNQHGFFRGRERRVVKKEKEPDSTTTKSFSDRWSTPDGQMSPSSTAAWLLIIKWLLERIRF